MASGGGAPSRVERMSGPLPGFLIPVTWPLSLAYGLAVRAHAALSGPSWQAPRPVISVGNVSAGGTGKSPMVRWVCDQLRGAGRTPAVVMRGHRGGERSDEVLEHRACMPAVPVAVGADRRQAIQRLLAARPEVDALVLDDGFQHRRVARDLDLVLVDAARPAIDGAMLPLGWLREPARGLRRASAVVITRASRGTAGLDQAIVRLHGAPAIARADHAWSGFRILEAGADRAEAEDWLRGRAVSVWAGLGHPEAFLDQVAAAGARVVHAPRLRDHQAYGTARVARLLRDARAEGAQAVVCTGKDWAKLADGLPSDAPPVARPELRLAFTHGEDALRHALRTALDAGDARVRR